MSLPEHLDVHYDDFPNALPMIGKIVDVLAKDDTRNILGKFTMYHVDIYQQRPSDIYMIDQVPALGQFAGLGNESEDPYIIGQLVSVGWHEGDPNRPYIAGPYFNQNHETTVAQTTAEHPHVRYLRSGTLVDIDKAGNAAITLADGASFKVKDNAGNVIFELVKVGANYEVNLGGSTGLKKLMTDSMIGAFNAHTHTGVTTGPGASGPPSTPISSAHATSLVNAK